MRAILTTAALVLLALLTLQPGTARGQDDDSYGFDIVDKDGKGSVTLEQFMAVFEDKAKAAADFKAMDANGDGILTKAEFLAAQGQKK